MVEIDWRSCRLKQPICLNQIVGAAVIPWLAASGLPRAGWVTGGLGVLITVLEGLLHLNQFQQNWVAYR